MKVLIATTNLGKVGIYRQAFDELGIEVISLRDLDIDITVEENGATVIDNAVIKAMSYHKATGLPVLANDSGLIIDKFSDDDQPGLLVRRYNGKELTDNDLLNLYIDKLNAVGGSSTGHYNVGLAIVDGAGVLHTREFHPKRYFISTPSPVIIKGIPLSSLCYDKSTNRYLSEMSVKERNDYEGDEFLGQLEFIKECFKV